MTELPENYKERLAKKREKALAEVPEGFEFVGWIYEEKLYHYALQSDSSFAVYRKIES